MVAISVCVMWVCLRLNSVHDLVLQYVDMVWTIHIDFCQQHVLQMMRLFKTKCQTVGGLGGLGGSGELESVVAAKFFQGSPSNSQALNLMQRKDDDHSV